MIRMLLYVVSWLVCLQVVHPFALRETGEDALFDDYRGRMNKRSQFYPVKDSFMTPLGVYENAKDGLQSQRKKAVDSTFIRFGRSSLTNGVPPPSSPDSSDQAQDSGSAEMTLREDIPRLQLKFRGCRLDAAGAEILKALLNNPNCGRLLHQAKRDSVNDTFIRFGKREAPRER